MTDQLRPRDFNGYTPDDDDLAGASADYRLGYRAGYAAARLDMAAQVAEQARAQLTESLERIQRAREVPEPRPVAELDADLRRRRWPWGRRAA